MNVQCEYQGKETVVRTDEGYKTIPNYDNILEILVNENVLGLLKFYYERDSIRYKELRDKKDAMDDAGFKMGIGCLSVAGVSCLLGVTDVLPDAVAQTVSVGAVTTSATYEIVRRFVSLENKERLGLRECLKYQEDRIDRLETKITKSYAKGKVVEKIGFDDVDDKKGKNNLNSVLNFIFYMGCHREKIRRLVKKTRLHSFLREEFGINDIDCIIEIENYVYKEFSSEFEKASGYTIK